MREDEHPASLLMWLKGDPRNAKSCTDILNILHVGIGAMENISDDNRKKRNFLSSVTSKPYREKERGNGS
ncbi:hypothetical protein Q0N12_05885 [Rossellomorea marisflavi]|uniref:hypothetical protein n=1 Tax=Rossellomorea marisflavi TaxID=189381 RepID=UPI003458F1DC